MLCDAPDWRAGHRLGELGKPLPKPKPGKPHSKPLLAGYYYGLRTFAWGLWCSRNDRAAIYDGQPWPPNEPPPMTSTECELYIAQHAA